MKKVFIFLPDGVGLRNFVFTNFYKEGIEKGFDIVYWNNTAFEIKEKALKVASGKSNSLTDIFKRIRKEIELKQFFKQSNNKAYISYRFPQSFKTFKTSFKSLLVILFSILFNSTRGLKAIRNIIKYLERNSEYYKNVKEQLIKEKPDFIFSTNQRPLTAIAPMLAARDIGIPTATFIFSWDNLPKGTLVIETDFYFVWSTYMKKEVLKYYPFINEYQLKITGTPQFEPHYNTNLLISKEAYFKSYNLDFDKKYICFSGDDITTSPNDQFYLEDVAKGIKSLNNRGYKLGLLYRKCPVDFSNRHILIYEKYKDIITLIDPLWENLGNSWNAVLPKVEDTALLVNTVKHTEMVINVGSSMAFDYVAHNKPCAFLNYNTSKTVDSNWNIEKIYKYIHFKSIPSKNAVLWINAETEIETVILEGLNKKDLSLTEAWYATICEYPFNSSKQIWKTIHQIVN